MPSTTPLSRTASDTSSVMSRTARPPVVRRCRSCWKSLPVRHLPWCSAAWSADNGAYCEGSARIRRVELVVEGDLSGTVVPGRGLGSELMRDSRVNARFEEIAGFRLVPGTLNVRLPGPLVRDERWRFLA